MIAILAGMLAIGALAGMWLTSRARRRRGEREVDERWFTEEQTWWAQLHKTGPTVFETSARELVNGPYLAVGRHADAGQRYRADAPATHGGLGLRLRH